MPSDFRTQLKTMRPKIEGALKPVGEALGVTFALGNCRFDPVAGTAAFKLDLIRRGENGEVVSPLAAAWKSLAPIYGFKEDDLGKTFRTFNGTTYTIAGLDAKRRARPIVATRKGDGKSFLFGVTEVQTFLKK